MLRSICCLQSSKAAHLGLSLQPPQERHSHSCHLRHLMVTYGHLWSLLSCIHHRKHRDSKSKIRSWAFSRPDPSVPNTPATVSDTGAAEHRNRGTLLSGCGALCFTALYALYRYTLFWCCPSASAGKGQLLLSGSLLTPTYFIKFPGRCFPVFPNLCPVLLLVKGQKKVLQKPKAGHGVHPPNVAETWGMMNLSNSLHTKTPKTRFLSEHAISSIFCIWAIHKLPAQPTDE